MNKTLAALFALTLLGSSGPGTAQPAQEIERALYVDPAPSAFGPGKRLPSQAAQLVPLLVRQRAGVQPLASFGGPLLERAVRDAADAGRDDPDAEAIAETDGAARVRLLLSSGISAEHLSDEAAAAALSAPDRALAGELLERGMLRHPQAARNAHVLMSAVAWRRADVLPRLLEQGLNPNLRSGSDPSPVDYAIQLGAVDELMILLGRGGRMDGDALDRAVASNSEAMLRLVTAQLGPRLEHVCLRDTKMLVHTVSNASPAYWHALRRQGFATDRQACPGQAERVAAALAATPVQTALERDNLRARLPRLGARDES